MVRSRLLASKSTETRDWWVIRTPENIFLIEADKKGASALRGLTNALEAEARAAGAKELRTIGHAVINDGFLNPRIAERFGFSFRRINDGTIELLKVFE